MGGGHEADFLKALKNNQTLKTQQLLVTSGIEIYMHLYILLKYKSYQFRIRQRRPRDPN